ncbi:hypothetical protein [Kineococcus sp. SYSU DK001]|uniref:hypothetical protein n=1 Tax=Kineococcus sp. SYSU DK001 TaxID=3383122 RepID=UPI003D7CE6A1
MGDLTSATGTSARTGTGPVALTIESHPSTEVAGGFTGRLVGLRADGAGARVHCGRYLSG